MKLTGMNVLADMVGGWEGRQFINRKNVITRDGISQPGLCRGDWLECLWFVIKSLELRAV